MMVMEEALLGEEAVMMLSFDDDDDVDFMSLIFMSL
jgi:hypothetical protein